MMKRVFLGLLLGVAPGCNETAADGEDTGDGDISWIVGPVFEGYYGLTVGETTSVQYFILHEDGSVERGSTSQCEPNEPMMFGTWTQTSPGEIEIRTNADSWPGNPALELIRIQRDGDCGVLEAFEVLTSGNLTTKGGHRYSRGIPCLSECDSFTMRDIIECPVEPNPCQ